jgi:hypothetical protein
MRARDLVRVAAPVAALAMAATSAAAQTSPLRFGAGAAVESYTFDAADRVNIETLSLLTAPFAVGIGIGRSVDLQVTGAFARGRLARGDGSVAVLEGVTDTELRLGVGFGRDVLTITAIAQLPTGVAAMSDDEADVAGMIAADVLPFRISNWGTGGGVGFATAIAQPLGAGFAGGVSAGYVVAREFEPLSDDFAYRPGDQLHVRAALDRTFGTAAKASLQFGMQRYGTDRGDGANLFRPGTRVHGVGSLAFALGRWSNAIVYAGHQRRGTGRFEMPDTRTLGAQQLYLAGAGMRLPVGGAVLQPAAELRVLSGDESASTGYTAGAGASLELSTGSFTVVPTARARFGHVRVHTDGESGFIGTDLGLALRFGGTVR